MADIYLDACCFIYLVEGHPEWRTVVEQRLRNLEPISKLITSQLARLECRTKPVRDGDRALLERYDALSLKPPHLGQTDSASASSASTRNVRRRVRFPASDDSELLAMSVI